jgi:hypothetical protein
MRSTYADAGRGRYGKFGSRPKKTHRGTTLPRYLV